MLSIRLAALGSIAIVAASCHRPMSGGEDHSSHTMGSAATVAGTGSTGTVGLPASGASAAARMSSTTRRGAWIKVPFDPGSKDTIMAWISYPATTQKAPVVVVVSDINGLGVWSRSVADQAAAEGFIGVAPDFVSRLRGAPSTVELTPDSARKLTSPLSSTERNKIISRVAAHVMAMPQATQRYGVIGFCWGGSTVFMHAVNGGIPGYGGGVGFYGLPYMDGAVPSRDSLTKIKTPVMLFNGSKDARIGAAMPAIDSMMKALGKNYASKNFEGAVHGFMKSQDDPKATRDLAEEAANLAATKEAWPRTVEFLKRVLR
jgi:carboxymethylenebutenolidase